MRLYLFSMCKVQSSLTEVAIGFTPIQGHSFRTCRSNRIHLTNRRYRITLLSFDQATASLWTSRNANQINV